LIRQILKDAQNLDALYLVEGIEASWLEWGDLTNSKTLSHCVPSCGKRRTAKQSVDQALETIGFLATAATAEN